jgi:hypothetical protein
VSVKLLQLPDIDRYESSKHRARLHPAGDDLLPVAGRPAFQQGTKFSHFVAGFDLIIRF